jgi:hypothetical protein
MDNIYFPKNIFSRILYNLLSEDEKNTTSFKPSASLSMEARQNSSVIVLMPVTDIITNKEFFISKSVGISFEESLCNTYLYYNSENKSIDSLQLSGDISTMEVILGKILFKELYNVEVDISLNTHEDGFLSGNYILTGDKNFENKNYEKGISFSEELIEVISAPFVNYVFASDDDVLLKEYSEKISGQLDNLDYSDVGLPSDLPLESVPYIKEHLHSVFYKLDEQDIEGIINLIRLPYYHELIPEIFEVKFV